MSLQTRVIDEFQQQFGETPQFIIRAPGRVNLIGEHTDYNDGFVLPMAIDRAVWLAIRPRTDNRVYVTSTAIDTPTDFTLDNLENEGQHHWSEYLKGVTWALQEAGHKLNGWEGVLASDVPVGAGLSSSAAIEMATARAFTAVTPDLAWDPPTMALLGQKAENQWVGANTGIMDQMISAAGEQNHALFIDCRDLSTKSIPLPAGTAVVIMDSATRHTHVDSGYNTRREQCETAASFFAVSHLRDVTTAQFESKSAELEATHDNEVMRRARHVITENERVLQAIAAMQAGDATTMGRLMNESHKSMDQDFEITNEQLNVLAQLAQAQEGCFGARMTGGGFGGCAVALVAADQATDFATAVSQAYDQQTNLQSSIYICQATAGAAILGD